MMLCQSCPVSAGGFASASSDSLTIGPIGAHSGTTPSSAASLASTVGTS